jgi:hypothetical protein
MSTTTTAVPALTTTFTPPASCLSTVYSYGGSPDAHWDELGPADVLNCLPPAYQTTPGFFYSPGVCPEGYSQACSSVVAIGSLTETRATCCPR